MAFIDEWRRWHHSRMVALAAPYGPLATLREAGAAPQNAPSPPSRRTDGATVLRVPFAGPDDVLDVRELTDQQRHLIEVEGAHVIDAIEDHRFGLTFRGVEVFEPHHDWIVPAEVIDPVLDGGRDDGDASVHFVLGDHEWALTVTRQPLGAFHATFTDPTRDARYPSRNVHIPAPEDGLTTIDFNRVVLPLASLSPRFPVAVAPVTNHLGVPVTAGEHRAYCGADVRSIPA